MSNKCTLCNVHCAFVEHVQSKLYVLVVEMPYSDLSQNIDFPNLLNKTNLLHILVCRVEFHPAYQTVIHTE